MYTHLCLLIVFLSSVMNFLSQLDLVHASHSLAVLCLSTGGLAVLTPNTTIRQSLLLNTWENNSMFTLSISSLRLSSYPVYHYFLCTCLTLISVFLLEHLHRVCCEAGLSMLEGNRCFGMGISELYVQRRNHIKNICIQLSLWMNRKQNSKWVWHGVYFLAPDTISFCTRCKVSFPLSGTRLIFAFSSICL